MKNSITFGPGSTKKFFDLVNKLQKNETESKLFIISCYFSPSHVNILSKKLLKRTEIYFDIHGLQEPLPKNTKYKYFGVNANGRLFHPKIYFFNGDTKLLLITSSNFTKGSIRNIEAGYLISGDITIDLWNEIFKKISKFNFINERDILNSYNSNKEPAIRPKINPKKWRHQDEAVNKFLDERFGILNMATGTGKTRTALKILNNLLTNKKIDGAVITAFGTDLLHQWEKELYKGLEYEDIHVFRQFDKYKEISNYLTSTHNSILLISKDFLSDFLKRVNKKRISKKLLVCDEVHRMGSPQTRTDLNGKLSDFLYRLGLSATPEREYDKEGNEFIDKQIGPVIYNFNLKDAIKRGILCEFEYRPLFYDLSDEDNEKIRKIFGYYESKPDLDKKDMYKDIARVKKLSKEKIPIFKKYINENPNLLDRTIIFVETKEYGEEIQKIIINIQRNYHTYYSEDERINLEHFAAGKLSCLLTCKRISEGIDIKSINNIILFSCSRAKLETIQRIGRSLRIDPLNLTKKAIVIDFIIKKEIKKIKDMEYETADYVRYHWLKELSKTKREEG